MPHLCFPLSQHPPSCSEQPISLCGVNPQPLIQSQIRSQSISRIRAPTLMPTYLSPHSFTSSSRFRDVGDDAMDVESSSEESFTSSRSQTLSGTGSPTPGPYIPFLPSNASAKGADSDGHPVEQITTLLTCGNCSHDVILSGPLLTSNLLLVPSTPVPHMLYTNSSPSTAAEETDVYTYIQHTNKAIGQLNWEISRTNAILEMLILEREKLVNLVEEHKALLSPWRRTPPDILGEIFTRCERGGFATGGASGEEGRSGSDSSIPEVPDSFDPTSGPLLLSQICKQWRTQALRMPDLWSTIRIRVGRGELQESRRLPLIHAWLERSSNQPLTICMVERSPRSPLYSSDSRNLAVGMLLGNARRWKRLYLALHSKTPHWNLFTNIKGMHLPLLEECAIVTPKDETNFSTDVHPDDILLNLLSGATALKDLKLDYNVPILNLQFPRNTITHLDLYTITKDRSIPISMAFETLYHCPKLHSFKVRCHLVSSSTPPQHLYHTSLHSLNIIIDVDSGSGGGGGGPGTGGGLDSLLTQLTPSNLARLTISTPELEWDQDLIIGFLARCGGIKEFRVRCKNLEKRWLKEILDCSRVKDSVEILGLDIGLNVTDDLLEDLSIPPIPIQPPSSSSQKIMIPKLKSFELGGRLFISSNDFLGLVTSRRYHHGPSSVDDSLYGGVEVLEEVVVDCEALVYGFMTPYFVEQLDELRWWGLRVWIRESGRVVYPLDVS